MKNISWIFIFVLVIVLIMIGFSINNNNNNNKDIKNIVTINGHSFNVELATTEAQREKGLMNRDHLDDDAGMLFVFPNSDIYPFWMKDTKIPLDIIYINDNKIVEMTTLQPAGQSPLGGATNDNNIPQYTPQNKADKVLEINAKEAVNYGFKVGDLVEIKY